MSNSEIWPGSDGEHFELRCIKAVPLFCGGRGQGSDLLLHTVSDSWVHGGATREDSVGMQVFTDVNITFHDAVVGSLMDARGFHS